MSLRIDTKILSFIDSIKKSIGRVRGFQMLFLLLNAQTLE